jgi:hypothetical protein
MPLLTSPPLLLAKALQYLEVKPDRLSPPVLGFPQPSPRSSRIHVFILRITISCSLWRAASSLSFGLADCSTAEEYGG